MGLETRIVDAGAYESAVRRCAENGVLLPTFRELADPTQIPEPIRRRLASVGPDEPHPSNLFRVHWYNARDRVSTIPLPDHIVLPSSLTGVEARIVVLFGETFPLIHAHKVLAAYGCLAPRLVTGLFDPIEHRAIWPSTGNYCRGGVAISRIMSCHGVAVLPEGMSRERFEWLERWVLDPDDIVRTPGTESNVKEIYDRCAELARDPRNVILNQFSEFGNYLVHYLATGAAAARVFDSLASVEPDLECRAFVAATGSGGTLAAGDYLESRYGSLTVAAEALECPTLLYAGFGEHNIQGIGDKHVPLIHNVMSTDCVAAVSERATDALNVTFNDPVGRDYLATRRKVPRETLERLDGLGLSAICNVIAAIKTARYYDMGPNDVLLTVATDAAALYDTEREKARDRDFGGELDVVDAAAALGRYLFGTATDHFLQLDHRDRQRIFNLGYYTWVEQQNVPIADFQSRRHPAFWRELREIPDAWDAMIQDFNARTGVAKTL
jgi:hypothetical protein